MQGKKDRPIISGEASKEKKRFCPMPSSEVSKKNWSYFPRVYWDRESMQEVLSHSLAIIKQRKRLVETLLTKEQGRRFCKQANKCHTQSDQSIPQNPPWNLSPVQKIH